MTMARMMAAALCLVLWAAPALAGEPAAKPADAKVRIGVYDSRAIAVAFVGSEAFKASDGKELADKKAEYDKAKAEGNVVHLHFAIRQRQQEQFPDSLCPGGDGGSDGPLIPVPARRNFDAEDLVLAVVTAVGYQHPPL